MNEEVIDKRFPFFMKSGLALYRDTRNEYWNIDMSGSSRTTNGHYARIKISGGAIPTSAVEWEVRSDAGDVAGGGAEMGGRELTVTFLKGEAEVSVWEAWLPQSHAALKQSQRTGKKGAIGIECPPSLPGDDIPGSVTTRFDGEYLLSGIHDGFPRYSSLDRGQPSGGLQLYHS